MEFFHKILSWWNDHVQPGHVFLLVFSSFASMLTIAFAWFKFILKRSKIFGKKLDFVIKSVISLESMLLDLMQYHMNKDLGEEDDRSRIDK